MLFITFKKICVISMLFMMSVLSMVPIPPVSAAVDSVSLLESNLVDPVTIVANGDMVYIKASDGGVTFNNTSMATVTDLDSLDEINVTLYDDGTNGDTNATDGVYYGKFTIVYDQNASGSLTNNVTDTLDLAHGKSARVDVNLDNDANIGSVLVVADFQAPAISISIGSYHKDTLELSTSVDDDNLNVSSVGYKLDNLNFVPFSLMAPVPTNFFETVDISNLTEGDHTVTVRATDDVGNYNEVESLPFTVDRTPPEIQELDLEGALLSGELFLNISFNVGVGGAPLGAGNVTYRIDGGTQIPFNYLGNNSFSIVIDMKLLIDGPHNMTIEYTDAAGNTASNTYNFTVDTTVPKVTTGKITYDQYWNLSMPVNVSDPNLDTTSVRYKVEDGAWVYLPINGTSVEFNITIPDENLTVGDHIMTIEAKDLANNTITVQVTLKIIAHPGQCSGCKVEFKPDGTVVLSWISPGGSIDSFRIYHSTDRITDITVMTGYNTTSLENFTWGSLPPGTHYFAVVAVFNGVEGPPCFLKVMVPKADFNASLSLTQPLAVPTNPKEGDIVNVNANLTNSGPAPMKLTAVLMVDGAMVDTRNIDLDGNSEKPLNLGWSGATSGAHDMKVEIYQRGSTDVLIIKDVSPNPLYVKKASSTDGDSWIDDLLGDTPLAPVVKATGSDFGCCLLGIVLLVVIIGVVYALVATRKKEDPDDELKRAMARKKMEAPSTGAVPQYPEAPKKEYPKAPPTPPPTPQATPPAQQPAPVQPQQPTPPAPKPVEAPPAPPVQSPPPTPPPVQPPVEQAPPPTPPPAEVPPPPPEPTPVPEQPPAPQPEQVPPPTPVAPPAEAPAAVGAVAAATPDRTEELKAKIEELKGRSRKASMDAIMAVSKSHAASTQEEVDAAVGKVLISREKAESALRELEEIAQEASAAGLEEEVMNVRTAINKSLDRIRGQADKVMKKTG